MNTHSAASKFFARTPPPEYIQEWTEALKRPILHENKNLISVMVFRLGKEWLALPTIFFKEIKRPKPVHAIPHKSGKILKGIVNINGELKLYISLHEMLQIEPDLSPPQDKEPFHQDRMIVIIREADVWVLTADEIEGIFNWDLSGLENVPVNAAKSRINYIKGIMKMGTRGIGLLDEELLFASLKRSIE